MRQSGVGLRAWTGVGAAVHKQVGAGVESADEEPHISAVVLEVEEEVVAYSAGSSVEQNGGKVLIQIRVFSLHNPPHIGREVNREMRSTFIFDPLHKLSRMILGENEASVSLEKIHLPNTMEVSHQRIRQPVVVTELQWRLNLVTIS